MLGQIIAVTITVASLGPTEKAYNEYLGYKAVAHGKVSAAEAKSWGAPKVSGHKYVLMQPASGSPHYIRFVETAAYPDYQHMQTTGWNAVELLVQDPDAVHAKLKNSPFKIVGEPRGLSADSKTKAMQVTGPSNELLYLTNPAGDANKAVSEVDRFFVVIDGSTDYTKLTSFYNDMGAKVGAPAAYRLGVFNRANGLDPEMKHEIAMARLTDGPVAVELDHFPAQIKDRVGRKDDLPPGQSIVTFEVPNLDDVKQPFVQKPAKMSGKPYDGRRAAVVKGPSGELLELVETKR